MSSKHSSPPAEPAEVLAVEPGVVDPDAVDRAVNALLGGGIVAMRTDTVYGLLASVNRPDALRRLGELKGRPEMKPFVVLAADWIGVRSVTASLPSVARYLASRHWPGPLTLVLPTSGTLPREVTQGGSSVGVRIPGEPLLRAVIAALKCPVAAPSANRSGREPARSAPEVQEAFPGGVDLLLDAGPVSGGRASTIVDCMLRPAVVLREGPVELSADDLAAR